MPTQSGTDLSLKEKRRIVVVGGGIAGLAAAYRLTQACKSSGIPADVILCEGSRRVGGTINTYRLDDIVLELGPDSFITEKPAGINLVRELGIENRLIRTDDKNRRTFIAHNDSLHPLPDGFLMMAPTEIMPLLSSDLFSWGGKLRMLQELFVPAAPPDADESLSQFVQRRLGKEALDRVIQPLVGGIYTADPDKLSLKSALPRIAGLEQKYGSVIRGLMATRNHRNKAESGARYSMFVTFDKGMSVLVETLERALPANCIKTHAMVSRVLPGVDGSRFRIQFSDGSLLPCDGVIVATPAYHAADMLFEMDAHLSAYLRSIDYCSSAVLSLIYKRSDIKKAIEGFGFVVPRTEKKTILAASFSSMKFPGRVPDDKFLMRVFVGGALQPDVYDLSDVQIECLAWQDLHTYLGLTAAPMMSILSRFPKGMPQYNVGHSELIQNIDMAVNKLPGLALAGNAYAGVGIPDCIESGERAARQVLQHLPSLAS